MQLLKYFYFITTNGTYSANETGWQVDMGNYASNLKFLIVYVWGMSVMVLKIFDTFKHCLVKIQYSSSLLKRR